VSFGTKLREGFGDPNSRTAKYQFPIPGLDLSEHLRCERVPTGEDWRFVGVRVVDRLNGLDQAVVEVWPLRGDPLGLNSGIVSNVERREEFPI